MSISTVTESAPSTPSSGVTEWVEQNTLRPASKDSAGVTTYMMQRIVQNMAINGAFAWWQRQASGTYTTYSNTSGRAIWADRFGITNENASVQTKRVDSVASAESGLNARYYASIKKTTSNGKIVVSHVLSADTSFPLRSRYVRVSARLRTLTGTSAQTMRIGLLALSSSGTADTMPATFVSSFGATSTDPTWGTNLSAIVPTSAEANGGTCVISGSGLTCTLTGAWQRFGGSFLIPVGTQNLVVVIFTDGQVTATDEYGLAEVQVTEGQEVRDWITDDQTSDLLRCQRYYFKTFLDGTAPAQSVGADTGEWTWTNGIAGAGANHSPAFRYAVPMRSTPTLTFYNPSAANALIRDETAGGDSSANTTSSSNANGFRLNYTGNAGGIVGGVSGVHFTADAEI
jgi:hypothetical protein